uniref:Complement component 1 Q subcomponent-binding protein, mitochondrial n=1 Tax=Megaselia scalaris TaxID=36166 RepID=T1H2T9_MEGSC
MSALMNATRKFMGISGALKNVINKREFTRTLWIMSKTPETQTHSIGCSCGCGAKHMHTKGERELVEFLTEEILAERKAQKIKTIPTEIDGFKVKLDGADVELTKQDAKEKIVIKFNVNHTVDTEEAEAEVDAQNDKADFGEMKSKPQFEVDIVRGNTTLSLTCSFLNEPAQEGEYNDVFGIDEMTIFNGEWNDKVYAVAGDVLDGVSF